MSEENIGVIRVAPSVLTTIVRRTTLETPGVVRLDEGATGPLPRATGHGGIRVEVRDDAVYVTVYIVAASHVNLLELGRSLQAEICRALETMVGLPVYQVDVYIQDIV
jgi:uncharacterized alkaline shock family protein YloU